CLAWGKSWLLRGRDQRARERDPDGGARAHDDVPIRRLNRDSGAGTGANQAADHRALGIATDDTAADGAYRSPGTDLRDVAAGDAAALEHMLDRVHVGLERIDAAVHGHRV